jgi:hypothetical protein
MTAFSVKLYKFKTAGIEYGVRDGILDRDSDQGGPRFESDLQLALVYRPLTEQTAAAAAGFWLLWRCNVRK